jgi:hypothetical protein
MSPTSTVALATEVGATDDTDGLQLGDLVRDREQGAHDAEGGGPEVRIDPPAEDLVSVVGQFPDERDEIGIEKLDLIDDHKVGVRQDLRPNLPRPADRDHAGIGEAPM